MASLRLGSGRPAPSPDPISARFFEALAAGRWELQRCSLCHGWQLGRIRCVHCGSTGLTWQRASGRGTVHSSATVHATSNPEFNDGGPYGIAIIELEEGPQLYANVLGFEAAAPIGTPVRLVHSRLAGGAVVPVFEPMRSGDAR